MKSYDVPECITNALIEQMKMEGGGIKDLNYHLYGAGRAIGFVKMAADAIEELDVFERKPAEYHAYAGISSARTAIDASASWLNLMFSISKKPGPQIDLAKERFRGQIVGYSAKLDEDASALSQIAKEVDGHRQRAQHREGLALDFHAAGIKVPHTEGWYLAPLGISTPHSEHIYLPTMLREWANRIERRICSMVAIISA